MEIYEVLKSIPSSDFNLYDQLRRAVRSVPANISEGCGRNTARDELRFCIIARGSLKETCNHLIDAYDCGYVTRGNLVRLKASIDEVAKLLNGYISHLKRKLQTPNNPTTQPRNNPTTYNFSYNARSRSRVIFSRQSFPSAFSHNGAMPKLTSIIVSNSASLKPAHTPCGIGMLFSSTMR